MPRAFTKVCGNLTRHAMPPKADSFAEEEDPLVGKWVWLKVEDDDLWCLSQVKKHWQGQVFLERMRAPKEVSRTVPQMTDA